MPAFRRHLPVEVKGEFVDGVGRLGGESLRRRPEASVRLDRHKPGAYRHHLDIVADGVIVIARLLEIRTVGVSQLAHAGELRVAELHGVAFRVFERHHHKSNHLFRGEGALARGHLFAYQPFG
ncbi:hypothetical protein SDC9_146576 [bioreactor metagenome]|uniref:Uncharacterized protein n=1 Tax=bioreactor metagenome TaxID=1076179 RepID=A0A645ED16_9ZZZZ